MLSQSRLKEVLSYDPNTGVFTWIKRNGNVAGGKDSHGYIIIKVDNKSYKAHRLAWLYIHGYFPENDTDHLNGIRDANRLENLHEATRRCNQQNCKIRQDNTSGFPGVSWDKPVKKWKAYISINRKQKYLGCHPTALDAALARFTVEVQCPEWHCNHRSKLVKAIKGAWPEFSPM